MSADKPYSVGYKKPPRNTRFRKGQSGNPQGRPKGAFRFAGILQRALNEPVAVVEQGERRSISKLEAVVKQLVNKAAGGDLRAVTLVTQLIEQVQSSPEEHRAPEGLHPDDQQVLRDLFQRMKQQTLTEMAAHGQAKDSDES
jgi:hypothetical protein